MLQGQFSPAIVSLNLNTLLLSLLIVIFYISNCILRIPTTFVKKNH